MNRSSESISYDEILGHSHWYHRIPLGDGKYTPGRSPIDDSHWDELGLPNSLDGKSVLDIGAANGLHSFEAERRGADRMYAIDLWDQHPGRKRAFELVHTYLDSDVEYESRNAYQATEEEIGRFDIVICSGVIYHLRDPYLLIKNAIQLADELAVFETALTQAAQNVPVMKFSSTNISNNPDTIFWEPNLQCLKEMAQAAGGRIRDAHEYQYTQASRGSVPPIVRQTIQPSTTVYESVALSTPIGAINQPTSAEVLYNSDGKARVKLSHNDVASMDFPFTEGKSDPTAWIHSDRLTSDSSSQMSLTELVRRSKTTLERQGLGALRKKAQAYLTAGSAPLRGVVKAETK